MGRRIAKLLIRRVLTLVLCVVILAILVLLIDFDFLFVLVLAPVGIYAVIGFRLTRRREAIKACLSPSLLLFPFLFVLWYRSETVMSYCLVAVGQNSFIGGYVHPGVVEVGCYKHDPAGLKYLEQGVTKEIANVMTDDVRRFQTFGDSDQVYDYFCLAVGYGRIVPVVDGWCAAGSVRGVSPCRPPSAFYWSSGQWAPNLGYSSAHLGFHLGVPMVLALVLFVRGVRRWREHERRLREGLCLYCGYNLTGNVSGRCPECGKQTCEGQVSG